MLLKNALPLNRGNPGASPSFTLRKKCRKALVEPLESAALDRHRAFRHLRKVPAALGQGLALVEVCPAPAGLPVAVDPFFQGGIVELALLLQRPLEPAPAAPLLRQQAVDNLPCAWRRGPCGRSSGLGLGEGAESASERTLAANAPPVKREVPFLFSSAEAFAAHDPRLPAASFARTQRSRVPGRRRPPVGICQAMYISPYRFPSERRCDPRFSVGNLSASMPGDHGLEPAHRFRSAVAGLAPAGLRHPVRALRENDRSRRHPTDAFAA